MASKTAKKSIASKKSKAPVKRVKAEGAREVSLASLRRVGACTEQVEVFEDVFGDSVEITVENIKTAEANGLDLEWICGASSAIRKEIEKVWFGRKLKEGDVVMDTDGGVAQVDAALLDDNGNVSGLAFTNYEPCIYKLIKE